MDIVNLKAQNIVFGALARDCAKHLQATIRCLEELGSAFRDYKVVVYENDSTDGTAEMLQKWMRENPRVISINEVTEEPTIPAGSSSVPYPGQSIHRIAKMAAYRNRVLEEVKKRFEPDYFCFIDIDIESFNPQDVMQAIEKAPADWGALFANGQIILDYGSHQCTNPIQYDYYAYVPLGTDPYLSGDYAIRLEENLAVAWVEQQRINRRRYHPCHSAFNGIGIYRWELIKDLEYIAYQTPELKAVNASLCEHVPFNYEVVKQGYRLYVARDMKTIMRHDKPYIHHGLAKWKNHFPSYDFLKHNKAVIPLIIKFLFHSK